VATAARETTAFLGDSGAALLVPDDAAALAGAIVRVLTEPGLAERMAEAAAALAHRPDVTWDGRARSLIAALRPGTPPSG
jgi:glycosyltransferase involved in cell wall biosynthesis